MAAARGADDGGHEGMATAEFVLSRRLRASPFEPRVLEHGAKIFTLYNKMTLPMEYESLQADYEHLKQHVQPI